MDEETVRRIFEPFYTTKETGKGTGLGLSVVYGIVKKHNGHILCTSRPGEGSDFRVYLPLAEETTTQPPPPPPSAPATPLHSHRILLIDFDETSSKSTRRLLEEFGYSVIEAENKKAAIARYHDQQNPIHLVILDGIADDEHGVMMYREIRETVPLKKILFCCGAQDAILKPLLSVDRDLHVLTKPFPPKELLMKISEVVKDAL